MLAESSLDFLKQVKQVLMRIRADSCELRREHPVPVPFSILIAPAYVASVTAYESPQFKVHSLSR